MNHDDYIRLVAAQLVKDLEPAAGLGRLTSNSTLKGAYVEAAVRQFVANTVAPLRVCHGGIVDNVLAATSGKLRELDTIIWAPNPAPAIFCIGGFGMVPRSSAFGLIEVKRSNYTGAIDAIETLTGESFQRQHLWRPQEENRTQAIGVICVIEQGQPKPPQLTDSKVIALFEDTGEKLEPRPQDIATLVNFLADIREICREQIGPLRLSF